jgi:predicted peptidase
MVRVYSAAAIVDIAMVTNATIVDSKASRRRHFGRLEICLVLSFVALLAQLFGPEFLRFWREWPRPGHQTVGRAVIPTVDGRQTELRYLVYLPTTYSSRERFPLLLFLHGSGQRGDDLDLVEKYGPPALVASGKSLPFIVVSPQCPANATWDSGPLLAILDTLQQKFFVDPDRIYVAGFSMGGTATWDLVAAAPERFAAAVPVAGVGDPNYAQRLTKLPIWAFHGALDTGVPLKSSQQMVAEINAAGGNARLTVLENEGHSICDSSFRREGLWSWLLEQRRRSATEN